MGCDRWWAARRPHISQRRPPSCGRSGPAPRRHRAIVTDEALFSRIFPDPLYVSSSTTHGGRMADEILTIREVAELLKLNEKTAYKLALAGEIPGFKVGGSWRFERQAIASWIRRKVEEQQNGWPGKADAGGT